MAAWFYSQLNDVTSPHSNSDCCLSPFFSRGPPFSANSAAKLWMTYMCHSLFELLHCVSFGPSIRLSKFRKIMYSPLVANGGGSRNFERERRRNTIYQSRRTLSQMHIMNCMRFIREKATYWQKFWDQYGGGGSRPTASPV